MDFKKIRIIEAGPTANDWTDEVNGELKTGKIVITPESLASLVVLVVFALSILAGHTTVTICWTSTSVVSLISLRKTE